MGFYSSKSCDLFSVRASRFRSSSPTVSLPAFSASGRGLGEVFWRTLLLLSPACPPSYVGTLKLSHHLRAKGKKGKCRLPHSSCQPPSQRKDLPPQLNHNRSGCKFLNKPF
ncbi:hypothetical protein AMECASPLE_033519 [Ameca splendens]|uniref:Uncharacterized protein n=1 Tax=Ameca splendens TaxID=208324 RepID=A0ABV0XK25_9TELE